ncbi:MAG: ribosome maturation factor [Deltaproteobacteria bacterium]|nr:MAG: ribosome maturation factor [Deltaproteobacteria bacterium]
MFYLQATMPNEHKSEQVPCAKPQQPTPTVALAAVRALAEPFAVAHGVELFDVEWISSRTGNVLRVSIERPVPVPGERANGGAAPADAVLADAVRPFCAGVTVDDCARLSRDLSTALDAEDPIGRQYTLEVSSPGADRVLASENDLRRHVGRSVKLKLAEPAADGQMVLRGAISSVADGIVRMAVDGNHHEVALDNVTQAKLVFELGAQKKGAKQRHGRQRRSRSQPRASRPEAGGGRPGREQADDHAVRQQDGSNE